MLHSELDLENFQPVPIPISVGEIASATGKRVAAPAVQPTTEKRHEARPSLAIISKAAFDRTRESESV